jgi:hypothetical protein
MVNPARLAPAQSAPGPRLRSASLPPPPSGSVGQGLQGLRSLQVPDPGEGSERGGGQWGPVNSRLGILFQMATQPAGRDSLMAVRIPPCYEITRSL